MLVLVVMTLLVTKSLHVYSHSLQILKEVTHSSCCSSDDSNDDTDKEGHKHGEHRCLICDFVVSPFLEGKFIEYSFAIDVVHYTPKLPLIEDERSEILVHKGSRAPPALIFS